MVNSDLSSLNSSAVTYSVWPDLDPTRDCRSSSPSDNHPPTPNQAGMGCRELLAWTERDLFLWLGRIDQVDLFILNLKLVFEEEAILCRMTQHSGIVMILPFLALVILL